jgi:NADPH:quinone reductase-like Zn-dependent oxidoreductase
MRIDEFGGPEVLHETEVPTPEPAAGQVRVRTRAVGLNPLDAKVRSGGMAAAFPTPLPALLGIEVAGTVDAVGDGVSDVAVGDDVFGLASGGAYAEYALSGSYAPKPAELDWAAAVALPVAGETAGRVLDLLDLRDGETLLINGAAGAVGTMAVQLAVARDVRVIGTAAEANHEYLKGLGAIPTTYGPGLVDRVRALAPDGIDAVFDVAGRGALADSIELRGGTGRIITIADPAAGDFGVRFSSGGQGAADLAGLAALVVAGKLSVNVDRTFPLAEVADAHRVLESGHARGKLVLLVP